MSFPEWEIELHGHRVYYRMAGSGPPLVLIHGMVNSSRHWEQVALKLADRFTVIAPDLIGHGDSAAPRNDYSLGAHAASIRDILAAIGVDRATLVGHSYGGGVAMQFFYQFPGRTERIALISSGGLGDQVSPLLRSAAVPGAALAVGAAAHPRVLAALVALGRSMRARGRRNGIYLEAIARALRPLERPEARKAFLHTLRAVIDARGQRVAATDRLYLLETMPILIAWGSRDKTIPVEHGLAAHAAIAGSRFEVLEGCAHFPHLEDPEAVARVVGEWMAETEPSRLRDEDWGQLIRPRSPTGLRGVEGAP